MMMRDWELIAERRNAAHSEYLKEFYRPERDLAALDAAEAAWKAAIATERALADEWRVAATSAKLRAVGAVHSWGGGAYACLVLDGSTSAIPLEAGFDGWFQWDRTDHARYAREVGEGSRCTEATRRVTPEGLEALKVVQREQLARLTTAAEADADATVAYYRAHTNPDGWCDGWPTASFAAPDGPYEPGRKRYGWALARRGLIALYERGTGWRLAGTEQASLALIAGGWVCAWRAAQRGDGARGFEAADAGYALASAVNCIAQALRDVADPDAVLRQWLDGDV